MFVVYVYIWILFKLLAPCVVLHFVNVVSLCIVRCAFWFGLFVTWFDEFVGFGVLDLIECWAWFDAGLFGWLLASWYVLVIYLRVFWYCLWFCVRLFDWLVAELWFIFDIGVGLVVCFTDRHLVGLYAVWLLVHTVGFTGVGLYLVWVLLG